MEDTSLQNVAKNSQVPAIIAGGALLGLFLQSKVNEVIDSDGVKGLLGTKTTSNLKKYIAPLFVTFGGVAANMRMKGDVAKNISAGVAISGPLVLGARLLGDKNPLRSLSGLFGNLGDPDDEDLGDNEDDEELGDNEDDDLGDNEDEDLGDLGENGIEGNEKPALPAADIKLNVEQSEIKQMEGNFGDLIPSKAPGVRDPFPEPIFAGLAEDINLI